MPENLKENIYLLTESGINLAPVIFEIVIWADKNIPSSELLGLNVDKRDFMLNVQNRYRELV